MSTRRPRARTSAQAVRGMIPASPRASSGPNTGCSRILSSLFRPRHFPSDRRPFQFDGATMVRPLLHPTARPTAIKPIVRPNGIALLLEVSEFLRELFQPLDGGEGIDASRELC